MGNLRNQKFGLLVLCVALLIPGTARASISLTGTPQDIDDFLKMLQDCTCKVLGLSQDGTTVLLIEEPRTEDCPTACPSLRRLVNDMLVTPQNVRFNIGRSSAGTAARVIGDRFFDHTVDLDDLDAFAADPAPQSPEQSTRCELIAHFVAEYHCESQIPPPPPGVAARFNACHPVPYNPPQPNTGLGFQNQCRRDAGKQTTVLRQTADPGFNPITGNGTATITYSDGSTERWTFVNFDLTEQNGP